MSLEQVQSSRAETGVLPPSPLTPRFLVPIALALVACAVTYAATVGAHYVQNAMWTVPLSEIADGSHDPKDLAHPLEGARASWGYLAILVTPLLAGATLFFVGADVSHSVRAGRCRRQVAPAAAVLALSVVVVLGYLATGPLTAWFLD